MYKLTKPFEKKINKIILFHKEDFIFKCIVIKIDITVKILINW